MNLPSFNALAFAVASACLLASCGGSSSNSEPEVQQPLSSVIDVNKAQQVLETNADIAYAAYSDSVTTAEALKTALTAFRKDSTQANLDAAKKAWLVAREPYGQTEVYRFRLSPIDSTDYADENGPEGEINAWPLGEALIDYVETGTPDFGNGQVGVTTNQAGVAGGGSISVANYDNTDNIIGKTSIDITKDLLAKTATDADERDVIAGYHAIEFLLWGQDLKTADNTITNGTDRNEAVKVRTNSAFPNGGQRPLSDFEAYADGAYDSSKLGQRRHKYLEVAVDKLIEDLTAVRDGWKKGVADNYRAKFTSAANETEARKKITEILKGMGTLSEGELAGERIQIAYSTNSQEDEHSCFSDNTHRDIWLNAEGVANSYRGDYNGYDSDLDGTDDVTTNKVSGYGIDDYLQAVGLTTEKAAMDTAVAAVETQSAAIDAKARAGEPVDVLIMDAKRNADNPLRKIVLALNDQSVKITKLAEALKITETVVDDDGTNCDTTNPDQVCPD